MKVRAAKALVRKFELTPDHQRWANVPVRRRRYRRPKKFWLDLIAKQRGLCALSRAPLLFGSADGTPIKGGQSQHPIYAVADHCSLPVYDLGDKAAGWGSDAIPSVIGWVRVSRRPLETDMFVAKVVGHSMEPGISGGAWGLFRSFASGDQPSAIGLDERRVVARLTSEADSETGPYVLRRWKVTKVGAGGKVLEVTLRPDNRVLKPLVINPTDGDAPVVAEFLETVG